MAKPYKTEFCRLAIGRLVPWMEAHGKWLAPTRNFPGHFALETNGYMCIYAPVRPLNPWEVRPRAELNVWVVASSGHSKVLSATWDPLEVIRLERGDWMRWVEELPEVGRLQ
jgi:hypothetical protein